MESLMDRSVIRIHLKTAKKNDRMDVCSGHLEMVRNSAFIINKLFETIYYFPESISNHEVQSYMQRKRHRAFPSLHKCIYSLNQENQNVVLVNTKCAYAMEETDCLVKILLDLSNKYKNVIDLEYDAVKNCLQDKHILENGQEDVRVKHTGNFESRVDSGNTKCQNQEKKNTMQKRQKVLQPRSKKKDELDENKFFSKIYPIFRIRESNYNMLMGIVNSNMDPYSLCEADGSVGVIVYDEGLTFAVPQPQPPDQTNTRNDALPNTTVSIDNPTQGRRLEESPNSESEEATVPDFTAGDRIRCPWYKAYHVRLSTFTKWPSNLTQKPEDVAKAGFYYTGLKDVVKCFACDGGLKNWDPKDDPWIEHARWFPLCPFVQKVKGQEFVELVRRMTEESDEIQLASVSNDNLTQLRRLGGSSNVESVPSSIPGAHEQHRTQHTFISRGRTSGSEHVNVLNYDDGIRCPEYQAYHVRLSTFTKWPSDMTQKPEHVAGAGFYYTGLQDAVRCFACDGGLQNWDPEDNPWIEHCHRFPQCPFVQRKKLDERNNQTPHPPD